MPYLSCSSPGPNPSPYASVSGYRGFILSKNFIYVLSLVSALALLNRFWYVLFHVNSVFKDVSMLSGSHASAVASENALR